jgi:hypothetical protein
VVSDALESCHRHQRLVYALAIDRLAAGCIEAVFDIVARRILVTICREAPGYGRSRGRERIEYISRRDYARRTATPATSFWVQELEAKTCFQAVVQLPENLYKDRRRLRLRSGALVTCSSLEEARESRCNGLRLMSTFSFDAAGEGRAH